jgi:hypothetical protein
MDLITPGSGVIKSMYGQKNDVWRLSIHPLAEIQRSIQRKNIVCNGSKIQDILETDDVLRVSEAVRRTARAGRSSEVLYPGDGSNDINIRHPKSQKAEASSFRHGHNDDRLS